MRLMDFLFVISGFASIISLALSVWDRFAKWRKFILPLAWGLAGFTVGRFATIRTVPASGSSTPLHPSTEAILFLVILGVICCVVFALLRRNEPIWAYLVFSLGLSTAGPALLKSYSDLSRRIPVEDFVLLSRDKERVGDFAGAIAYLEKAFAATNDNAFRTQLDTRKKELQSKLLESLPSIPPKAGQPSN